VRTSALVQTNLRVSSTACHGAYPAKPASPTASREKTHDTGENIVDAEGVTEHNLAFGKSRRTLGSRPHRVLLKFAQLSQGRHEHPFVAPNKCICALSPQSRSKFHAGVIDASNWWVLVDPGIGSFVGERRMKHRRVLVGPADNLHAGGHT
jgi:hypothetical protein